MASRSRWKKPSLLHRFEKSKAKRSSKTARKVPQFSVARVHPDLAVQRDANIGDPQDDVDNDGEAGMDHTGILSDCESDVGDTRLRKRRKRPYTEQQKKKTEAWDAVTELLADRYLPTCVFDVNTVCSICSETAAYRCNDCGPWMFFCEQCCIIQHSQCCFLHVPEKWTYGQFVPVMMVNLEIPLNHSCSTEFKEKVSIVSRKGYHRGLKISFCMCKSKVERLVELHLWPATPHSPRVAFTMDLLNLIHAAMLECQVSLHHASSMLWYLSILRKGKEKKNTYQQLLASFPRYRCFKNRIDRKQSHSSPVCPACPMDKNGTGFVCLDGNFRLCRLKKAGQKSMNETPLSAVDGIFADQSDVDQYLKSCSSQLVTLDRDTESNVCHEFKAGDALRSKSRYHALDETGVFGATCRHDIPLKMLSMKQGEKLAYADYIVAKLVEECKVPFEVNLLYDIGCKLISHWKRNPDRYESLSNIYTVAVPIFHVYAHNARCQYYYSPRHKAGFGLTDGENLERLWSYLGKFSRMTKEMNPAHQIDTLSGALSHYSDQKSAKMENSIVQRMKKACVTKTTLQRELERICASVPIHPNNLEMKLPQLRKEELKRIDSVTETQVLSEGSVEGWNLKYVQLLQRWFKLQEKWTNFIRSGAILTTEMITETVAKLARFELELKDIEHQNHIEERWQPTSSEFLEVLSSIDASDRQRIKGKLLGVVKERVFYVNTLRYHAGGQKQAQRVSKLISACTSKAKNLLSEYTTHSSSAAATIENIFDMSSTFWSSDHTYALQAVDCIPLAEQRRLIEIRDVSDRCLEELQYCVSDILNVHEYFSNILIHLNLKMCSVLQETLSPSNSLDLSDNQLYMDVGRIVASTSIPRKAIEILSYCISKAEYTFYRLQRISDVIKYVVLAYWEKSDLERMNQLSKALVCSEDPISVPGISLLFINAVTITDAEEDDYESEAGSDSEEETLTSLCSDTDTDLDTETEHDS